MRIQPKIAGTVSSALLTRIKLREEELSLFNIAQSFHPRRLFNNFFFGHFRDLNGKIKMKLLGLVISCYVPR